MAPYKQDCDSNDCELPSGQATPSILARGVACEAAALPFSAAYRPIAARSSGVKEAYFRFLPCLACFPASSRSNAAVTAWFTSLRTFADSCVERSSERGVVTCNIINCVFLSLSYRKTRNSQSKESRNRNPTYGSPASDTCIPPKEGARALRHAPLYFALYSSRRSVLLFPSISSACAASNTHPPLPCPLPRPFCPLISFPCEEP